MQTSFSSFACADRLFAARGFAVRTLATQPRRAKLSAIEGLAPGCGDWLRALRGSGGAEFHEEAAADGEVELVYQQRIAVAVRA